MRLLAFAFTIVFVWTGPKLERNLFRCVRARANDAKIARSRDAQCNTEESL